MKTSVLIMLFCVLPFSMNAQEVDNDTTATEFKGRFVNDEYKIFVVINLKEKNVVIPKQEILGGLDGYFGSTQTSHAWAITSSKTKGKKATIDVINNYGSEDFTATLSMSENGTLVFQHVKGSTFKFPVKSKWQKMPDKIVFEKQERK